MCKSQIEDSTRPEPLKISSWNLNGYKSKRIGEKFLDQDFLNEIKNDGLVGIVETKVYDEIKDVLSIPGFVLLSYKNRPFNKKSKRGDGGIAVFIKENLCKYIVTQKSDNPNSVWVKIEKEFSGEADDIFKGTVYFVPHTSNSDDVNKLRDLEEEIFKFSQRGKVMLQGDFNARSGAERDYILPDKSDLMSNTPPQEIRNRNSEDMGKVDNRGKELLDMCKSTGMVILNGRKMGDFFGKYTCFRYNGSSVVDYVLINDGLYDQIELFKVGNFIPWLSDHCATHFQIKFKNIRNLEEKPLPQETFNSFYWGEESSEQFTKALKENAGEFERIQGLGISSPEKMRNEFTSILLKMAGIAGIKMKKKIRI